MPAVAQSRMVSALFNHKLGTSRSFVALGAGVGIKMTFTLVNELYEPQKASQIWLI